MNIPVPLGEEVGPKLVRLLSFVGAGSINKWKDLERKAVVQKQQQEKARQLLENISSN